MLALSDKRAIAADAAAIFFELSNSFLSCLLSAECMCEDNTGLSRSLSTDIG